MIKSASILAVTSSALVIAAAAVVASPTAAQTAGNLKCNGCVNSKDIKNGRIKNKDIKDGQLNFGKLAPEVSDDIIKNRTFYATADSDGEEVTLATNGPLRIFMRCLIDDGGFDKILLFVTSSLEPWYQKTSKERFAGEEVGVANLNIETGLPEHRTFFPDGGLAPDGSAFTPDTAISLGLNLFGHRCLAVGNATAIKGTL